MKERKVCVDASLVVKWLIPEELSEHALGLLRDWRKDRVVLLAPALLMFEVLATIRKHLWRRTLTFSEAQQSVTYLFELPIQVKNDPKILGIAWDLANQLGQPTVYDTSYLALAQMEDCALWTADKKFARVIQERFPNVRALGEQA
ncbi:MAG: type II toxin-antitoxin system VapC family toxin [Syntrophothermus sp.]